MLIIREIRLRKNMTLDQLATKSGVSKRMISAYEANENDITLSKLQNIAIALEATVSELIGENTEVFTNEMYERLVLSLQNQLVEKERLIQVLMSAQAGAFFQKTGTE